MLNIGFNLGICDFIKTGDFCRMCYIMWIYKPFISFNIRRMPSSCGSNLFLSVSWSCSLLCSMLISMRCWLRCRHRSSIPCMLCNLLSRMCSWCWNCRFCRMVSLLRYWASSLCFRISSYWFWIMPLGLCYSYTLISNILDLIDSLYFVGFF